MSEVVTGERDRGGGADYRERAPIIAAAAEPLATVCCSMASW